MLFLGLLILLLTNSDVGIQMVSFPRSMMILICLYSTFFFLLFFRPTAILGLLEICSPNWWMQGCVGVADSLVLEPVVDNACGSGMPIS